MDIKGGYFCIYIYINLYIYDIIIHIYIYIKCVLLGAFFRCSRLIWHDFGGRHRGEQEAIFKASCFLMIQTTKTRGFDHEN